MIRLTFNEVRGKVEAKAQICGDFECSPLNSNVVLDETQNRRQFADQQHGTKWPMRNCF